MKIIKPMRQRTPKITIYMSENAKQVYINKEAVSTIGLKENDYLLFGQDEQDQEIFYLFKAKNTEGFKVLQPKGGGGLACNSEGFTRLVRETYKITDKKITLVVSSNTIVKDGITVHALIKYE